MAVIAISIEPDRRTRIFFDCRNAPLDQADQWRIERAIEQSIALGPADEDDCEIAVPLAA